LKEIKLSNHANQKIEILGTHGFVVTPAKIRHIIQYPDRLETGEEGKQIAQASFDENRVLRVVYREFSAFILVITLYPGRKTRYEKN